jgi:hypothetical protein
VPKIADGTSKSVFKMMVKPHHGFLDKLHIAYMIIEYLEALNIYGQLCDIFPDYLSNFPVFENGNPDAREQMIFKKSIFILFETIDLLCNINRVSDNIESFAK